MIGTTGAAVEVRLDSNRKGGTLLQFDKGNAMSKKRCHNNKDDDKCNSAHGGPPRKHISSAPSSLRVGSSGSSNRALTLTTTMTLSARLSATSNGVLTTVRYPPGSDSTMAIPSLMDLLTGPFDGDVNLVGLNVPFDPDMDFMQYMPH
ncbi:hypothetical protein EWM64_g8743 [Hericium alpestre]|uniref:Uncharacterized protein n=1 Tax=Hericium alpestre TaxID=135208 RepID=A0A4Y9ZPB2_9AGAM|nr:hypothetical protein EWM64_g8743 [Hericium alpestre]